jgi:hypothetical protein
MSQGTKPLGRANLFWQAHSLRIEHETRRQDLRPAQVLREPHAPGERSSRTAWPGDGRQPRPLVNALKRLAQERIVEWVSRRGIYIKRFTKREMARLFEVGRHLRTVGPTGGPANTPGRGGPARRDVPGGLDVTPTAAAVRKYVERTGISTGAWWRSRATSNSPTPWIP